METESKPIRVVVYHCRNLRLFEDGGRKLFVRSRPGVKLVAVPCSGKVEAHHLLKTMAGGAEGVLVLACQENACRFLEGSMRAHKRVDYARARLTELRIEPDRIEYTHVPPMDAGALDALLEEFRARLDSFRNIPSAAAM